MHVWWRAKTLHNAARARDEHADAPRSPAHTPWQHAHLPTHSERVRGDDNVAHEGMRDPLQPAVSAYCRLRKSLAQPPMDWLLAPLYWYAPPSSAAARESANRIMMRWVYWLVALYVGLQATLLIARGNDTAIAADVKLEDFLFFPAFLAREGYTELQQHLHQRPTTATMYVGAAIAGLAAAAYTLPWSLLLYSVYALHVFQTRYNAEHAWDEFPWNHLRALLSPTTAWIHAAASLIVALVFWPWITTTAVSLRAVYELTFPHPEWAAWLRASFGGADTLPDTSEPDYWIARWWPLWSFVGIAGWNLVTLATETPTSGIRTRLIALHVLAALGAATGIARARM